MVKVTAAMSFAGRDVSDQLLFPVWSEFGRTGCPQQFQKVIQCSSFLIPDGKYFYQSSLHSMRITESWQCYRSGSTNSLWEMSMSWGDIWLTVGQTS